MMIRLMPAAFDKKFVRRLEGNHIKSATNKRELVEQVTNDIQTFINEKQTSSNVMIWCGSTEIFFEPSEVHSSLKKFEKGLVNNDPDISPSMLYAYASLKLGIPYANGSPNLSVDIPALQAVSYTHLRAHET